MKKLHYIEEKFKNINIFLTDKQLEQFMMYYELLIEKNKVMNLTAIVEFEQVVTKHFLDSVLISKVMDLNKFNNLIDVGTGAGFPGLPLKIVYPEMNIVLMDSLNKRVKFLDDICEKLNLSNINVIHSRAENLSKKEEHREHYDIVVSRAVANLSVLSEYCIPFVKKGGYFISYKSNNIEDEVLTAQNAIEILGGEKTKIRYIELDEETKRSFIIIKKKNNTPHKYPRKEGVPSNKPL